ncbi:hypothetical protein J0H58_04430 [bacterium]|nr:hypothetical protein [bacterium]
MLETISVVCPTCQARIKAPAAAAGRQAKCPKCRAALSVPPGARDVDAETVAAATLGDGTGPAPNWRSEPTPEPVLEAPQQVVAAEPVPRRPVAPNDLPRRSSHAGGRLGAFALVGAALCFVLAWTAYRGAEEADRREARAADASNGLGIMLAGATGDYRGLRMQEPRRADRSGVMLGVIGGVVLLAAGLVCYAVDGARAGRDAGVAPASAQARPPQAEAPSTLALLLSPSTLLGAAILLLVLVMAMMRR